MGFKVTVEKGNLHFDSAHFITYGGKCEHLHGHNYTFSITLEGPLTPDSYVFDFVVLKEIGRRVSDPLDHRFLLPLNNTHLKLTHENEYWEILFEGRRYVIPDRDVYALPIDNITAERLAEYIWKEVAREVCERGGDDLTLLTVGVDEAPGQGAYFSQSLTFPNA
ncbi:MAG TPA: 6-carboxytetrahydropterin synthase [Anaerolineaceae bacterium]|nr:6-carboxytetrahydropterin synthase [Anaerolineaceae bacterium]